MDAKERSSYYEEFYNFKTGGSSSPKKNKSIKEELKREKLTLNFTQESQNKIKLNNQKINHAISSQKMLASPARNLPLPNLAGFLNGEHSVKKDHSVSRFNFAPHQTITQREKSLPTKKFSGDMYATTRQPSPTILYDDGIHAKVQMMSDAHPLMSRRHSAVKKLLSVATSPRMKSDQEIQGTISTDKQFRAKAKYEKTRNDSQSKLLKKRDTSYIADALSRPGSPMKGKYESYRDSPVFTNRDGMMTPHSPSPQIPLTLEYTMRRTLAPSASMGNQQFSKMVKINLENSEADDIYSPSPGGKSFKRMYETSQHEDSTDMPSFRTTVIKRFRENLSKHFNTGPLDKINAMDYLFDKKNTNLHKTLNFGGPEELQIPRLGSFTPGPGKSHKTSFHGRSREESPVGDEMFSQMKKECPNVFSTSPAGRQDVLLLSAWVENSLKEIVKGGFGESERIRKCDEIYNLCLNELIRQVSLECVERGELLYQVWMSYYRILVQFKTNAGQEIERVKMQVTKERKMEKELNMNLNSKNTDEIQKLTQERLRLEEQNGQIQVNFERLLRNQTKQKTKIAHLKNILIQYKTTIEDLERENKKLNDRHSKTPKSKANSPSRGGNSPKIAHQTEPKDGGVKIVVSKEEEEVVGRLPQGRKKIKEIKKNEGASQTEVMQTLTFTENNNDKNKDTFTNASQIKETTQPEVDSEDSEEEEDDEEDSVTSESEFVFVDLSTKAEHKYNLDQLNSNQLVYKPIEKIIAKDDIGVQTDLNLAEQRFDEFFETQALLEELLYEKTMKKEIEQFPAPEQLRSHIEAQQKTFEEDFITKFSLTELYTRLANLNYQDPMLEPLRLLAEQIIAGLELPTPSGNDVSSRSIRDSVLQDQVDKILTLKESSVTLANSGIIGGKKQDTGTLSHVINTPQHQRKRSSNYHLAFGNPEILTNRTEASHMIKTEQEKEAGSEASSFVKLVEQQDEVKDNSVVGNMDTPKNLNTSIPGSQEVATPLQKRSENQNSLRKASLAEAAQAKEKKKTKEDLTGKVQLMFLGRLYKVEKERCIELRQDVGKLQQEMQEEKENSKQLENKVTELMVIKKELESLPPKCIHSHCPICDKRDSGKENYGFGDKARQEMEREVEEEMENHLSDEYDLEEDEFDEQESPSRKRLSPKNRRKKQTVGVLPEFAKKKLKEKFNPALAIIATIKNNAMKKFKNFIPVKGVLKHIFVLYNDRMKDNTRDKDEEFAKFVYTWFLNNFGFKKLAEQKFIIFLLSVRKYLSSPRINIFAKFVGLLDGSMNFSLDEFTKYLEAIEYTSKLNLGTPIQNNETDTKYYMPFLRVTDCIKYFLENRIPMDEYVEFRKGIELLKEVDPKGINRNGIIDFDLLMMKILNKYRVAGYRARTNVMSAFKAVDLDGDKICSQKEFNLLYRHMDPVKYDEYFSETVFNEHGDVKVDGKVCLSFDKFAVVCVEMSLFSDVQQDQFLEIQVPEDLVNQMKALREKYGYKSENIKENLGLMTKIPEEDKKYWRSILEPMRVRVESIEDYGSAEAKGVLIAMKIIEIEVEKLREMDLNADASKKESKLLQSTVSKASSKQ